MIRLIEPSLGTLELDPDRFVVVSFQVSAPRVRAVMRDRALADGGYDDTAFTGERAATLAVRLNTPRCGPNTIQGLLDLLSPYTNVKRRPRIEWSQPGTPSDVRQITARGEGLPFIINTPRHPAVAAQFVSADGLITSARGGDANDGLVCTIIDPSGDVEEGRTYDLEFDRVYPPSAAIGDRTIVNNGNADAHWTATIFGEAANPTLRINGTIIEFAALDIPIGESIVIDTKSQTILRNGDPGQPRNNQANYLDWQWGSILLRPGINQVRFGADELGVGARVQWCWRNTWES